jgi:hypothetical protein
MVHPQPSARSTSLTELVKQRGSRSGREGLEDSPFPGTDGEQKVCIEERQAKI